MKPRLTCSRSCSFYFLISPGSFLLRLFSRLFNRLLLKMKFVGRSRLFSFHGSLTLYLPVASLNRMVFGKLIMISSFLSLSSGILLISQNLVNRLSSFTLLLEWFRSFDTVCLSRFHGCSRFERVLIGAIQICFP